MNRNEKHRRLKVYGRYLRRHRSVAAVYLTLRLIVLAMALRAFLNGNYENFFVCVLVLLLFLLPNFVERKLHIELPNTLEIIILCFIFASEILGELKCYFIQYPHWVTMLHTTSGFLLAAVGFSLVDLLNKNKPKVFQLSPLYLALVAFCFSMTVGVIWEFFEFGMDRLFCMDMQKDTVVHTISSVMLDPTNQNVPVTIRGITDAAVNGKSLGLGGYLDIGLYDTMADLFVNFVGALVFSVFGYFYAKGERRAAVVSQLMPRRMTPAEEAEQAELEQAERPEGRET